MSVADDCMSKLREVRLSDSAAAPLLTECEFIQIGASNRIYFRPMPGAGHGFEFAAVTWAGGDNRKDQWVTFSGIAYFDGVRHMYLNRGADRGYVYYPDLGQLADTLMALRELERRFCLMPE